MKDLIQAVEAVVREHGDKHRSFASEGTTGAPGPFCVECGLRFPCPMENLRIALNEAKVSS